MSSIYSPSTGLAIYWLASTIGTSNARFKKLAKKDLLKCDVKKACNKLINPEEPLVRACIFRSLGFFGACRLTDDANRGAGTTFK